MKKLLLPLLALALSATAASAQDGPPQDGTRPTPEAMAARQAQTMVQQLGLSADQSAKVQPILLARDQEMMAMRSQMQNGGDRSQMRDQMMASRTKYDDQLKAVLTPDQFAKYSTMEAARRQGGRGGTMQQPDGKIKEKDGDVKVKVKTDS